MRFVEALQKAWQDVSESGVPSSLYEVAMQAGIAYYLGTGPGSFRVVSEAGPQAAETASSSATPRWSISMDALSRETGVAREKLEELLHVTPDGKPGINVGARRLGPNNAERTRAIALLCAGALHFGADVVDVPLELIRETCRQLGVYDPNNFARYVAEVPGFILSGPKDNRVLRAKSEAGIRFRQKVLEVTGEVSDD